MRKFILFGMLLLLILMIRSETKAQETGEKKVETFTELISQKEFPVKATFAVNEQEYELTATGAVYVTRESDQGEKIPMYAIVHYMAPFKPDPFGDIYEQVIQEKVAKQLNLEFARDMKKERLLVIINKLFQKAIRNYEIDPAKIKGTMDQFNAFFARNYSQGETCIFRWLPDGRFIILAQKQQKVLKSQEFASFFWRIWFGLMSPVDRGSLVSRIMFY
ncbi:MAG: chalcone isomerase family protein [candidate division KSB1 bacterium]|nr:chalcone isomerase family protein [candidate division KSB1 bacterium]